jgi:hypothetical protein
MLVEIGQAMLGVEPHHFFKVVHRSHSLSD